MKILKTYSLVFHLLLLALLNKTLQAQSINSSKYECIWAFSHPLAAIKVKCISRKCEIIYKSYLNDTRLDNFSNGGRLDAFRHVFYMAAFAQKIKSKKIRKLGLAHEKNNYRQFLRSETEFGDRADSLTCVMDLKNNEAGISIGALNKKLSLPKLSELVITDIHSGKAFVLMRDAKGNFLDCEGTMVNLNLYLKKWFVPKCLAGSDYHSK